MQNKRLETIISRQEFGMCDENQVQYRQNYLHI